MVETPLISLKNVHLSLPSEAGEVHILRGINFQAIHGETISIVGPSGSGKTSLIMVSAGLERASSGEIEVGSCDLMTASEDDLAILRREKMGIVFQNFHLVPTMSALENVSIPLELAGCNDATDRAREMLLSVGLEHRLTHLPSQLSGGEQQRTALARAFIAKPDLLLADEPTGNLDSKTGDILVERMFELCDLFKTTLLLITHEATLALRCKRMVSMENGVLNEK